MTDVQQPPPQPPWQPGSPPPQQPWAPGPPPHQPQPARKANGLAIAGFVLALIGFIGSTTGNGIVAAVLLCVVGLGLSIAGVVVASNRRSGRGLAIAGIVVACVGLITCLGASTTKSSSTAERDALIEQLCGAGVAQ